MALTQQTILLVEDVEENRGIIRQLALRMGVPCWRRATAKKA